MSRCPPLAAHSLIRARIPSLPTSTRQPPEGRRRKQAGLALESAEVGHACLVNNCPDEDEPISVGSEAVYSTHSMSRRIFTAGSPACRSPLLNRYKISAFVKGLLVTAMWRSRGIRIADRVVCLGAAPSAGGAGTITIGSRVSFRGIRARTRLGVGFGGVISIGDRSFINSGVILESSVSITIGNNCLIGDRVQMQDSNYHEVSEGEGVVRSAIAIGNNVWIGNSAIVLPGVKIGDHSVIGAGSVVTKDVPPRTVFAGNPARYIRDVVASESFKRA